MFSNFREVQELWDYHLLFEEQKEKLNKMFDDHELSLFFKKDGDYFGGPENSRIIFAKLKNNDKNDPLTPDFKDQAKFLALNLIKSMIGDDPSETMFGFSDLPKINICDREEVIEKLMKPKKGKKDE